MRKRILVTIILLILLPMILSTCMAWNNRRASKKAHKPKASAYGYTVIDASTVMLSDGSVVKKDWQVRIIRAN